jgi:hypothetical protein
LNPFKIRGIFNFEFVPEFITCNTEGFGRGAKEESCSLLSFRSPQKVSPFLDIRKIVFVNFEAGALENRIKSKGARARLSVSPSRLTEHAGCLVTALATRGHAAVPPPANPHALDAVLSLRCPRALAVPIHCRPWAIVEANPISPPREALLPASARSVRAQHQPPMPPAIGDSTPRLRPRFNLHELRTGPAHLSDHSADFLDVCPSHSRRSPPPEQPPSSSPPGTPPWAGRSGPPPASPSPPRARPQLHDVLWTRSQPRRPRYRAAVDEFPSTGCRHRGDVVSGEPSLLRLLKPVPHITGHLSDPRPHLTAPLFTRSGHRRRPAPWIEPLPCFSRCKWATSPWVARPFGWAGQRWPEREQYPFLISFVFIQIKFK